MSIHDQCSILQKLLEHGKIGEDVKLVNGNTLPMELPNKPEEIFQSFLMTLSSEQLKDDLKSLQIFIDFYNQMIWDVISMAQVLKMDNVIFQIKFDVLKLKNIYSDIPFTHEIVQDVGQMDTEFLQGWKHIYAGLLVQKLIYMNRENMQMSFKECFQETLQVAEIPHDQFTVLFANVSRDGTHQTKFKEIYFGYFENLKVAARKTYYHFEFQIQLMKYLAITADGEIHVTLKAKRVGMERRKLKLKTGQLNLSQQKKSILINFE